MPLHLPSLCALTFLGLTHATSVGRRLQHRSAAALRNAHAGHLSQRIGAALLARRVVYERGALDDFEVLAGGFISVDMTEGDSNFQRL